MPSHLMALCSVVMPALIVPSASLLPSVRLNLEQLTSLSPAIADQETS